MSLGWAAGAFALRLAGGGQPASAAGLTYTTAPVERRDITAQITGSGVLEAADSYSVTSPDRFCSGAVLFLSRSFIAGIVLSVLGWTHPNRKI